MYHVSRYLQKSLGSPVLRPEYSRVFQTSSSEGAAFIDTSQRIIPFAIHTAIRLRKRHRLVKRLFPANQLSWSCGLSFCLRFPCFASKSLPLFYPDANLRRWTRIRGVWGFSPTPIGFWVEHSTFGSFKFSLKSMKSTWFVLPNMWPQGLICFFSTRSYGSTVWLQRSCLSQGTNNG